MAEIALHEIQKGNGGSLILGSLENHYSLFNRRIQIGGNFPAMTIAHSRGYSQRKRDNSYLGVAGLDELGGLRNVFTVDEFAGDLVVDPRGA